MTRIDVGAEGEVLTRDECLHRLASGSVGRVSDIVPSTPVRAPGEVQRRR